ncbi:protein phosphatase 2C 51 [Sesamum alatum]|uniref:protein-serine/threonine phosphatase n=1 Tax=Sesamum alatum TaxID=300844 RepID=A0AAE2CR02_9LAMI|nr:protein phosphatase 2C 51 [Sesamum alatum]
MIFDSSSQRSRPPDAREEILLDLKDGEIGLAENGEAKKPKSFRRKRMELRRVRSLSRAKSGDGFSSSEHEVVLKKKRSQVKKETTLIEKALVVQLPKNEVGGSEKVTCFSSHGTVSVIGRRREMEDAVAVELGFLKKGGKSYDFFGVYDGHGGWRVAHACGEMLHKLLVNVVEEETGEEIEWEKVMVAGFEKMDEEVNKNGASVATTGSTAVVAVVGEEVVVVANCGDSRAVLSRGGVAVQLSDDHKPDRADELRRIEACGGKVINWNGHRVLGVLATSRSIGDYYLKPYVIPEPQVRVIKRSNEDEFLILASDGLWDVVSNDIACHLVRKCLDGHMIMKTSIIQLDDHDHDHHHHHMKSCDTSSSSSSSSFIINKSGAAAQAAGLLVELAMARGSCDNISVTVVDLKSFVSSQFHNSFS